MQVIELVQLPLEHRPDRPLSTCLSRLDRNGAVWLPQIITVHSCCALIGENFHQNQAPPAGQSSGCALPDNNGPEPSPAGSRSCSIVTSWKLSVSCFVNSYTFVQQICSHWQNHLAHSPAVTNCQTQYGAQFGTVSIRCSRQMYLNPSASASSPEPLDSCQPRMKAVSECWSHHCWAAGAHT